MALKELLALIKGNKSVVDNSSVVRQLTPALKDSILSAVGVRSLSTMPAAAQKAFALASNPKAEARDFVEVIEVDEGLSARVIKIANSVFFDRGKKSTSIDEAVVVIGLNELRSLLNANALADIFHTSNPVRNQLWAHDIAVALTARQLAQSFLPASTDAAFLAGLMHDVGKLLLIQRCPEDYAKILSRIEETGSDFCTIESEIFPFDHCEVGQLIAEKWNFSPDLSAVISQHHKVSFEQPNKAVGVLEIVAAADIIAHSLGLGFSPKYSRLRLRNQMMLQNVWTSMSIAEPERVTILDLAKRNFEAEYDLYAGTFGG